MERLDLKFRAEPARPATGYSAGWWILCIVGLAAGFGGWSSSRSYLARRLSDDLASAQSPSEAFLALEGLLMLDSEATLEIARGLQHPNSQIARTAYRTLDAQITGWAQLEASVAAARMRNLSQRLSDLPQDTPADNLVLASSLASRIFTICLELDDPQLAPVMTNCESVFQRIAQPTSLSQSQKEAAAAENSHASTADIQDLEVAVNALRPPPPLTTSIAQQFTLSDDATDPPSVEIDSPTTLGNAAGIVPTLGSRDALHSSTSEPTAKVQFLTASTRPRSSVGSVQSLADNLPDVQEQQPAIVQGPASVASAPLKRVHKLTIGPDLENMHTLKPDQLVRLLGSVQPQIAQAAALELVAQGFSDEHLRLAVELATSLPEQKVRVLESIVSRTDIPDHRPWLLWMADEGEPEVRKQAVAYLSTMADDIFVQQELKQLLLSEQDEGVAHAMRQVLVARGR